MILFTMFASLALSQTTSVGAASSQPVSDDFHATRTSIPIERDYEVAGLFGGTNAEISRRLASGAIGCPDNEIGISNEKASRGVHTFTAHCRGREYFCTYNYPSPITCSQAAGTTDADVEERREELAEGMEAWKEQVIERLHQAWERPDSYNEGQTIVMMVKVDERGRLLNLKWVVRTGDKTVDKSILKAFKRIDPYPVPADPGAAFGGVEFTFP